MLRPVQSDGWELSEYCMAGRLGAAAVRAGMAAVLAMAALLTARLAPHSALLTLLALLAPASAQFGGNLPVVDTNPNTNAIPVFIFQGDGYSRDTSWAFYNGTIPNPLISYTVCHRYKIYYDRPRMYIFTYAFDDKDANELYSEYHLGRRAFRICKKNTRYCAWHWEMPDFYQWR